MIQRSARNANAMISLQFARDVPTKANIGTGFEFAPVSVKYSANTDNAVAGSPPRANHFELACYREVCRGLLCGCSCARMRGPWWPSFGTRADNSAS